MKKKINKQVETDVNNQKTADFLIIGSNGY